MFRICFVDKLVFILDCAPEVQLLHVRKRPGISKGKKGYLLYTKEPLFKNVFFQNLYSLPTEMQKDITRKLPTKFYSISQLGISSYLCLTG